MTAPEYTQLNAYARVDGVWLAVLLAGTFACYVVGLTSPLYALLAFLTVIMTPFFVGHRLRRFRDEGRNGVISFLRAWAYVGYVFLYGSILFALLVYVYLAYMDGGYLMMTINDVLSEPETAKAMKQMGMTDQVNESLHLLGMMRPIDFALNMLSTTLMTGVLLGLPIAAVMSRKGASRQS